MLRRKSMTVIREQAESHTVRVFDFISLLAVGVGGTIGSGIFVLSGTISRTTAGPATCLSWVVGGCVCMVTALAYAELSCLIPSTGSTYSFSYYALGEVFAVYGAWFLTLEYGVAGSAVARSWGDKVAFYSSELEILGCNHNSTCWVNKLGGSNVNVGAAFIAILVLCILLRGVNMGRITLNILVVLKVSLVLFVIIAGSQYFDRKNLSPFVPEPADDFVGGVHGILFGSTIAFFGFIGFDEIATLTMEATKPKRDVPLSIIATIIIVTTLYVLASIVLVGMVPFPDIDADEGFGSAFRYVGANFAFHVVMVGQIFVVLPAVVLVSFLPQSRLQSALARDHLFPRIFMTADKNGNLFFGTLSAGIFMTTIALLVPFHDLNDLISGGILLSFILTNTSLIVIRLNHNHVYLVFAYVVMSFVFAFAISKTNDHILQGCSLVVVVLICFLLIYKVSLEKATNEENGNIDADGFVVPFVPVTPCISILANACLIAQLSSQGLVQVLIFLTFVLCLYGTFACHRRFRKSHTLLPAEEESTENQQVVEIELN